MPAPLPSRLLHGNLAWEVLRFGAPLALGMMLQNAFNLVDAYLIAQLAPGEREAAVGAIGVCDQIAAVGTIISYGVSTATATLVSKHAGANNHDAIKKTTWQSLLIVLALSILFGLIGAFGPAIATTVVGLKGAVAEVTGRYLRVIMAGSFSIFFLLQLTAIQRSLGSAKTPVALLALGNMLNLLFAVVCLFGPEPAKLWDSPGTPPNTLLSWGAGVARTLSIPALGMVGAAWATIAARALVLAPLLYILAKRFDVIPKRKDWAPDAAELVTILKLAWPSSVQFVLRIGAALFVNSLVARTFTTAADQTATTAMGLVFRVDTLALFVAMGWGGGAQTIVAQNLGAGAADRAQRAGWIAAAYDAVTNVFLWLALSFSAQSILRFFGKGQGAVDIGMQYLRIVAPSYIPLGVGIVLGNAMVGAGAAKTTLRIDTLIICLVQVPLCLLAVGIGPPSLSRLFGCVALSALVSAIAYAAVYKRGKWRAAAEHLGSG